MPEQRQNPLTGQWVVIATNRAARPNDFVPSDAAVSSELNGSSRPNFERPDCPFCRGNENETPLAISQFDCQGRLLDNDSAGWQLRAVPNRYPVLKPELPSGEVLAEEPTPIEPLFVSKPVFGHHEVIIESPRHVARLTELDPQEIETTVRFYRHRIAALRQDRRWKFALLFKNCGLAAGVSLEHIHSQVMAFPNVPTWIRHKMAGAQRWYSQHRGCYFCQSVERENLAQQRLVLRSDRYSVFCPFASRTPIETWIVPNQHQCHFDDCDDFAVAELAQVLARTLNSLEATIAPVAYNVTIQTSPFDSKHKDHYHWHIEIFPRISTLAGLEWGTGVLINTVSPENAAKILKKRAG